MPSYVCLHPTCPTYLKERGYCDKHASEGKQERSARTNHYDKYRRDLSAKKFYNSLEWKHPEYGARSIKLRTAPVCERCETVFAEHVHHLEPIDKYPDKRLIQSNLIACCVGCHNILEAETRRMYGQ